jgi:hypothetical protein
MNKEQQTVLHYKGPPAKAEAAVAMPVSQVGAGMGARAKFSFDEIEAIYSLEQKYPELKMLPDSNAKRAYLDKIRSDRASEVAKLNTEIDDLERERRFTAAMRGLFDWSQDSGIKIERPEGPSFRKMRKAVAEGNSIYFGKEFTGKTPALDFEKDVFRYVEILVIEHDWAAAFKIDRPNPDFTRAEVKLPYDVCAFEFKFSGRPVIAIATQIDTEIGFSPAILCGDLWVLTDFVVPLDGFDPGDERNTGIIELLEQIGYQIKAACIALDADVARSDAVREPYSGAPGRNTYRPPKPYHVVSLARRTARSLPSSNVDTGRRVRLHFRRGHWRHFEDHKTWIKWMLVGDPDLGFVDKHYKL